MNVDEYIDTLPEDRRIAIRSVRELVNSRLPSGYEEGVQYGMISWFVPFTTLAETYNNQPLCIASLASQKQYMSLHLPSLYADPKIQKWFESEYKKTGKRLDMGKGCVRFKTLDDLALQLVGDTIAKVNVEDFVARYHALQAARKGAAKPAKPAKAAAKKAPAKKSARAAAKKLAKKSAKKSPAKRPAAKKSAAKKPAAKSKKRR